MRRGFNLTELMIVLAVVGVLAAIAIPNFLVFTCRHRWQEAGFGEEISAKRCEQDAGSVPPDGVPKVEEETTIWVVSCYNQGVALERFDAVTVDFTYEGQVTELIDTSGRRVRTNLKCTAAQQ